MTLSPFLPKEAVEKLKQLWLEGPEPPRISDNGWAGRTTKAQAELKIMSPHKSRKLSRARRMARLEEVGEDREVEELTAEKGGEGVEMISERF